MCVCDILLYVTLMSSCVVHNVCVCCTEPFYLGSSLPATQQNLSIISLCSLFPDLLLFLSSPFKSTSQHPLCPGTPLHSTCPPSPLHTPFNISSPCTATGDQDQLWSRLWLKNWSQLMNLPSSAGHFQNLPDRHEPPHH